MCRFVLLLLLGVVNFSTIAYAQCSRYFLPDFVPGTIYYAEGTVIKGPLNYNLLTEQIELKGDTGIKRVERRESVEYIGLELIKFVCFENSFGRIIVDGNKAILVAKYGVDVLKASGVKGISKYKLNSMMEAGLKIPEGISLEPKITYFLIRQEDEAPRGIYLAKSKFEKAGQSGFNKIFSPNKKEINMFVETNNICFSNEKDIKKLLQYCESLN